MAKRPFPDTARFYTIKGRDLKSVTTILDVINKPALGPWYAKQERLAYEEAIKRIRKLKLPTGEALDRLADAARGVKGEAAKMRSADVGRKLHAAIEQYLKGRKPSLEKDIKPLFDTWLAWWKKSGLKVIKGGVEKTVYCLEPECEFAGTLDLYATLKDKPVIIDWKTTNRIYAEAFLQNIAYRHGAEKLGMPSVAGFVVRVPKVAGEKVEVAKVPKETTLEDFLAAARLWKWHRQAEGKRVA